MANMNRLDSNRRALVLKCLVEGNSLRGTARLTGVARMTIEKLLRDVGAACAEYQDKTLRNLTSQRVQADEIWSFCYARRQNVPVNKRGEFGYGDVWTWTAIDADTKLVMSWFVGNRDAESAGFFMQFMQDVASRIANRMQLTTDGLHAYLKAVDNAFQGEIDYAMLRKVYGSDPNSEKGKYAPPVCLYAKQEPVTGCPDPAHINTSYVERQNLTMRMHMRRFTRLTNAFSKKVEMHAHAVALHFMHYNFAKIHQSLRVTPAMEAGLTDHVWSLEEIVALID